MKIELQYVHFMPKTLKPGVLYVSEEFGIAVHLCPCGCGSKISTPLEQTEWQLEVTANGPTLEPSIGNWQRPCQSHYWIQDGEIIWSTQWTSTQIATGYRAEEMQRSNYYAALKREHGGILQRFSKLISRLFKRK